MFIVLPVGRCSRVEDVFFSGQQRQAVRVQVYRSHPNAGVFLCRLLHKTSALQISLNLPSSLNTHGSLIQSCIQGREFCMRCVTSVSGELFEVEANTADVLHQSCWKTS